jgi:formylglycine-generating enzyme required for sulfatase activity
MRPAEDIRNAVKDMAFAAGPELDRRLWQDLSETRRQAEMTTRECRQVHMWRPCMNSKITRLAIAGVIAGAVLGGIYHLGVPVDGATVAMAQMRKALGDVPWMHVVATIEMNQGPDAIEEEWIGFDRSIEISKKHDGTVRYRDASQDTLSVYNPSQGTVTITSLSDRYAVPRRTPLPTSAAETVTAMLDTLQEETDKATLSITEQHMEGREVQIIRGQYQLDEDATTEDMTIVIDAQSKLPISIDATVTKDDATVLAQIHAVFDYPEDGPATIYDVGVPEDVTVIDRRPHPGATTDAKIDYHIPAASDPAGKETLVLYGGVNIDLVWIPAGAFLMGCPETEIGYPTRILELLARHSSDGKSRLHPAHEEPQHRVQIVQGFYMSPCEITCGQFRRFRPEYRRHPHSVGAIGGKMTRLTMDADDQPACVSLEDALAFCDWIGEKTGLQVRLPSEAEWEYACRAGTQSRFYWGNSEEETGEYANVADQTYEEANPRTLDTLNTDDDSIGSAPVRQYRPNDFGLYDVIGNVPEWVQGIYGDNAHSIDAQGKWFDPNTEDNQRQYCRGGSWRASLTHCRCAARWSVPEDYLGVGSTSSIGFRIVIEE